LIVTTCIHASLRSLMRDLPRAPPSPTVIQAAFSFDTFIGRLDKNLISAFFVFSRRYPGLPDAGV
jgi:hypothetical protein